MVLFFRTMKIISLAPSNTEILFSLGVGDRIVGRTKQCDYPAETKNIPSVSNWINNDTVGFLDELQPDLVLTSMFLPDTLARECKRRNIILLHVNPQTVTGIYKSMLQIGKLVNKNAAALRLIKTTKHKLDAIKQRAKTEKLTAQRVYCEEWHTPPTVSANWVPELVALAGGIPLGRAGALSYEVTSDIVMKFDPEVIIGHWCGFGTKTRLNVITQRAGWNTLTATQNGQIYNVDDSLLNRPGPRIWQGAEAIYMILKKSS